MENLNEEWKPIKGYENLYEISNYGRVRSLDRFVNCKKNGKQLKRSKIIKPFKTKNGYYQVGLWKNNTKLNHYISIIVYSHFVGPIPEGMQVNHINEDKSDNRLSNLNLMTPKENINWGTRNKRVGKSNSRTVYQFSLNGDLIKEWQSAHEVERLTGFNHSLINAVCNNKYKTAYGYKWSYSPK